MGCWWHERSIIKESKLEEMIHHDHPGDHYFSPFQFQLSDLLKFYLTFFPLLFKYLYVDCFSKYIPYISCLGTGKINQFPHHPYLYSLIVFPSNGNDSLLPCTFCVNVNIFALYIESCKNYLNIERSISPLFFLHIHSSNSESIFLSDC